MAPCSLRKRKRTAENQQNICPDTNMAAGEEEQLQQQSGTKKAESLPSPIVFSPFPPPRQRLDIAAHETLLRRLGLWEFLSLDLGKTIREDLINEVLASYKYYPRKFTGEGRVRDVSISLDRIAVAKALHLPVERAAKGGSFPVSKDESAFLENLIWGHLVLSDFESYTLEFFEGLKELRLVKADWAGLVWFMMERELLRGQRKNLVKCYYASHLQLVLKHQRPELFDDQVTEDGSLDDSLENGEKLLLNSQVGLNAEIPCSEQEDDVIQNKVNEATTLGNVHKVHNLKEDDVVVDEGSGAHTVDSVIAPFITLKDHHQPEFEFKDVESASVDLLVAHDDVMKNKGSPDGLVKSENQAVHFGSCQENSGNKFIYEDEQQKKANSINEILDVEIGDNGGIELGLTQSDTEDDAQKLHKFQDDAQKLPNFQVSLNPEIPCSEQEDDVMQNKANEATTFNNAHMVHNLKDGDVVVDEGSGSHTGDSFIVPCITLKDHYQPEFEFKDVESVSVDLLVAHDGVVKNKGSPDGLDRIEDQAAHLGSCQENSGNKFIFEDEQQKKANNIYEILDVEMGHNGGIELRLTQSDAQKLHKFQDDAQILHKFQIDLNVVIHSSDEEDDVMQTEVTKAACDTSTDNARTKDYVVQDEASEGVRDISTDNARMKEDYMVQDEASEGVRETSTDNACTEEDYMVQDETSEGVRETSIDNACTEEDYMVQDEAEGVRENSTDNAPKVHCLKEDGVVLDEGSEAFTGALEQKTVNNMNELLDVEMDHNGGTEVGLIQSDKENDAQKLHEVQNDVPQPEGVPETQQVGREMGKCVAEGLMLQQCTTNMLELDLDLCAEKLKVWTARFLDSARRKVEENQKSNLMLQKKIEEQNHIIQQYELMLQKEWQQKERQELMLQKERQQKLRGDLKYECELHQMEKVLEDYRKAIKQTNTSFAKYRERAQLPEEPLYMPHPDGGGDVILVSEWKKLEEERQKMAIETMVEDYEEVCNAYLEEEMSTLNQYCDRLEGLEHEVKTMSGRL